MVAAAQIDPFQLAHQASDPRLQRRPEPPQRFEILLAQGVDVQAVDPRQMLGTQLRHRKAEARTPLARVVLGDLGLAVLRVQAQADVEHLALVAGRGDQVGEARDLGRRIEDHRVRKPQDVGQVLGLVGRRIGGQVAVIVLAGQPRLPQARGADAVEVVPDDIRQRPHGEGLQRQQHARVSTRAHVLEEGEVAKDRRLVDDEGG